jgi:hypothetical protein
VIKIVSGNTGGSGRFSGIYFMRRDGDNLQLLEEMGGGDRCNNGIEGNVRYVDGKLLYTQALTAADFYDAENITNDKKLNDLEYCAICCKASANLEDRKITSYTLRADLLDDKQEGLSKEQACFEKQLSTLVKGDQTIVPQQEMHQFLLKTAQKCKQ